MSTNTPRSPFSTPSDDDDLICMDLRLMYMERQWKLLCVGAILWVVTIVALALMLPLGIFAATWSFIAMVLLKFRKVLADKLRPKNVLRSGNPRPMSDMAAMFCVYEAQLIRGKESHRERFTLISRMAQMETELEEHKVFSAAIARLRKEEATPNRREAILHSRRRKQRRAEDEGKKST
jgi:hypothetical protein